MTTLAPSFLLFFSLFMQVTRTTITSWMGSKFGKIKPMTYKIAAIEHLINRPDQSRDIGVSCP